MSHFVVSVDLGYGNAKIVYGQHAGQERTRVLPVGAAPSGALIRGLTGEESTAGYRVLVDGEEWVAGVDPSALENHVRVTDTRYVTTPQYKAMFYAALRAVDAPEIDCLVTGLPVSEYQQGKERIEEVVRVMKGEHFITRDRSVVVRDVRVLPQPVGAYFDALATHEVLARNRDIYLLVVDPGYGTVDWATVNKHGLVDTFSGTSRSATSVILEETARVFTRDHGHRVSPGRLEEALRAGRTHIVVGLEEMSFRSELETAAQAASDNVLQEISNNLRTASFDVDAIVLCGGAAGLYEPAVRQIFKSKVFLPTNPVASNARGFFLSGVRVMKRRAQVAA